MSILFERESRALAKQKALVVRGWELARKAALRRRGSLEVATSAYLKRLRSEGINISRGTLFKWAKLLAEGGVESLARIRHRGERRGKWRGLKRSSKAV